jgi:hypothetical protein
VRDGAEWIWNLAQEQFPGAIEIVDLYHARQHLWELGSKLHPGDVAAKRRWVMSQQHFLDNGKIEPLVNRLRALGTARQELAKDIETEANYFERNAARMRYPKFRKQGLFVGSGVIEAGCKTLIGSRLKHSGMFWTVRGANAIIAVRCCRHSRAFDDYWESRRPRLPLHGRAPAVRPATNPAPKALGLQLCGWKRGSLLCSSSDRNECSNPWATSLANSFSVRPIS